MSIRESHPCVMLLLSLIGSVVVVQASRVWASPPSLVTQAPLCYHDPRFNPTYEVLYDTEVVWQIPENPRAVLVIAHGGGSDVFSFFDRSPGCEICYGLPEDRKIVLDALDRKYAVIAIQSGGDEWISWPAETSQDKMIVTTVVQNWVTTRGMSNLPMVGFGFSSGGNFTSVMSHHLGMKSIAILDSPGEHEALKNASMSFPPTLFLYKPKDTITTGQVLRSVNLLQSRGVRVEQKPMYESRITSDLLALRNPCISNTVSDRIFRPLSDARFLDENNRLATSPREFDYTLWVEANNLLSACIRQTCVPKHVVQVLEVAYAFNSMSSQENEIVFRWFEASFPAEVAHPEVPLAWL